jgi:GTP-binding protein
VGKSTLFNRIIKKRKSITEDYPGVTRDLLEAEASWRGKRFTLIDTGGLVSEPSDFFLSEIKKRIEEELKKADGILFVVDGRDGLNPVDEEIARMLQKYKDKVYLVVNKVEEDEEGALADFYSLGFDEVFPVSALHGRGTGELLDRLTDELPSDHSIEEKEEPIKVAFVGRPNTGKSSLVNAVLGHERVIVSPIPGTTRDAVDIEFRWNGRRLLLVDTAGVRRPSRVERGVEFYSVGRTLRAIDKSDVVCLVLSAEEGITRQDKRLGGLVERRYKACVIVVNKMDLSKFGEERWEALVRKELFFLDFAPIVLTVATEGMGIEGLLEGVEQSFGDFTKRHSTSFIMRAVQRILSEKPLRKGKREVKVFYAFQEGVKPPTVVLITNDPDAWKENYTKFFVRKLRELLGLRHSPLKLLIKGR